MDQAEQLRALVKQHQLEETKKLQENAKGKLAAVITVTSGKGGVGKTSIAIIDADMGLANVEVMLGVRPTYDLGDIMYGDRKFSDIITKGPMGIGFISGGSGIHELNNLSVEQINNMTNRLFELDELADYIIVDTGAGITDTIMQFVKVSSQVLVVTTPEPTSITDAYAVLKALNRQINEEDKIEVKMISNRVASNQEGEVLHAKLNSVVEKYLALKLKYAGAVIQDNNLSNGILNQQPVSITHPNSTSVRSIKALAERIINDNYEVERKSMANFFTRFVSSGLLLKKGELSNGR